MRTVLIAFLVLGHVLPECLLALLAQEHHLRRLRESVRLRLRVAFCAVKPLLAARCADGDLGVQNMLAGGQRTLSASCLPRKSAYSRFSRVLALLQT